jgi:hypothetical protein
VDLGDYLWKNRLLLIFSPSESYTDHRVQKGELEKQMAEVVDRDLIVFEIFVKGESRIGKSPIANPMAESLRSKFDVKPEDFAVLLIGKDGGEKLRSTEHIHVEEIFSLIDAMPMRQSEMRERREGK